MNSIPSTPAADSKLKRIWHHWTQGLSFSPVFVLLVSTALLILFHENCTSSIFRSHFLKYFDENPFKVLYPAFYWYGCSFLVLGIIPLCIGIKVLRQPVREWGVGLGDFRFGIKAVIRLYGAFLPILVAVSYLPGFQAKYPLFAEAKNSGLHFAIYELTYVLYFIGWEFIFRGFMLFGLKPKLGYYAVFIQAIPFAIMHFGKPQLETISAIVAGVVLGYLALRTRSFWYGWMLHSLIAVTNDFLAICHQISS